MNTCPLALTAAHNVVVGQASAVSFSLGSIVTSVPFPPGAKLTSFPAESRAVHWLADGQAAAMIALPGGSSVVTVNPVGAGAKTIWWPVWSNARHWLVVGQTTASSAAAELVSIVPIDETDMPLEGSNVTSSPPLSTATQMFCAGQVTAVSECPSRDLTVGFAGEAG